MTVFTKRVANSNDDGNKNGTVAWSVSTTYVGHDNFFGDTIGGVRFNSVTVPTGATINSAKITFIANGTSTATYNLKIYGIDEDDTADFSSDPTGRTKTTAAIDWDKTGFTTGSSYDTADITTIIEEIIARAGWSSGNDMGFLILNDGTTGNNRQAFYDYAQDSTKAALLTIDYTTGSPSSSPSPSPSLSPSSSPSSSISPSPSPAPDFGIKITKPGFDVLSETDPENMVFTSARGVLGYRSRQTISGTTNASGLIEASYAHGLGYIPIVFGFVTNYGNQYVAVPSQWQSDWTGGEVLEENFYLYVDATNVYVKAYVHHYDPSMGGSDTDLNGQDYDFDISIYFNEMSEEY